MSPKRERKPAAAKKPPAPPGGKAFPRWQDTRIARTDFAKDVLPHPPPRRPTRRSTALDRVAYFASTRLSDSTDLTPEGYLICRNAVLGRTGFQTYKVGEIADPEGLLDDLDLNANDTLDLWRDADEVFSDATLASFEGKTFTVQHPSALLGPDSDSAHYAGHVQNVHQGDELLDDGNIPLLGDVIIKTREGIDAYQRGDRELSCGYTYRLAKNGHRFEQRDILGNHVALVAKARAGASARLSDSSERLRRQVLKNNHFLFAK